MSEKEEWELWQAIAATVVRERQPLPPTWELQEYVADKVMDLLRERGLLA